MDDEGLVDGILLGLVDGCDVGQSEDDGCSEGWLLGAELVDGDPEGIEEGQSVTDGASLGPRLGADEGMDDGCADKVGDSLGCDVGQSEEEGFSDG